MKEEAEMVSHPPLEGYGSSVDSGFDSHLLLQLSQIRIAAIARDCKSHTFGFRRFESCIWHRYVATPSNLVVGLEVFIMARFLGGLGSGLQNQIVGVQVPSELPKYIYYPLRRVYFFV